MSRRTCLALAVCLLVGAAGCTTPDEDPAPVVVATSPPPGAVAIDCAHQIGNQPPPSGYAVVLDAVALPTTVLEPERLPEGRYWAKTGLLVRAGVAADVIVAPEDSGDALIEWGSPGTPAKHQWVPACAGIGWYAYAGGYTADVPECVPLIVRAGGREARATVAVGKAC